MAMPETKFSANQIGSALVSVNNSAHSISNTEASHMHWRRPIRLATLEANGVITKMPSQPVAANSPAMVLLMSAPFRRSSNSGERMK